MAPQERQAEGDRAEQDEQQGDVGEDALGLVEVDVRGQGVLLRPQRGDLRRDDEADQHAAGGGAEGAARDQLGPLVDRLRHGRGQRAVGDVDQRVQQAEDGVGEVDVEQRRRVTQPGRHAEGQEAQEEQRHGEEEDERAELAPAGHGPVHRAAGDQVGEGVPEPHDEEHRPDRGGGEAGDVGVVVEQECGAEREGQVAAEVAQAVSDERGPFQGTEGRLLLLRNCCGHCFSPR